MSSSSENTGMSQEKRPSTSSNNELSWTDTNSWSGYLNQIDHSKQETKSKFDSSGFYTTETLLTTSENLTKNQMDSTSTSESYYNYMKRRYKEYIRELDDEERKASIEREKVNGKET